MIIPQGIFSNFQLPKGFLIKSNMLSSWFLPLMLPSCKTTVHIPKARHDTHEIVGVQLSEADAKNVSTTMIKMILTVFPFKEDTYENTHDTGSF